MKINVQYAKIESNVGRVLGLTFPNGKQVYIQRGLCKQKTFEVMVHELTHAALIHCGIRKSKKEHERIAYQVGLYARRHTFKGWH